MVGDKLTKWGTSVPEGYTVEEYEQMIEGANDRAAKTTEQIKAKQLQQQYELIRLRERQEHQFRVTLEALLDITSEKTLEFFDVLVQKRQQLRRRDEYGVDDTKWKKEKEVFANRVLIPAFERGLPGFYYKDHIPAIVSVIDDILDREDVGRQG